MAQQKDLTLRIQRVQKGTTDEMLIDFARSKEIMPMRQLILHTLGLCWLPYAYHQKGYDQETTREVAKKTAYQLENHLNHLINTFGLDRSELGSVFAASQSFQQVPQPEKAETDLPQEPKPEEADLPGEIDREMLFSFSSK